MTAGGRSKARGLLVWAAAMVAIGAASPVAALDAASRDKATKALAAAQAGQFDWADAILRGAQEPLLRTYIDWLRLRDRRSEASFDSYAGFLSRHPGWPAEAELQSRAEDAIDATVSGSQRFDFFADRAPRTRHGRIALAEALLAQGRDRDAAALLRQSWTDDSFPRAEEQDFLGRFGKYLTRADHMTRLDRLLWDGEAEAARRMFALVDADRQAVATARIQLRSSAPGVDQALAAVPRSLRNDPGLAYERVRWRRLKGRDAEANAILLDPPAELGRPDKWWDERSIQVRRAMAARDYGTAYRLAARHGVSDGADLVEAEWLAGWLALRFTANPSAALGHFKRMAQYVKMPISQARAGYWAGRAAGELGRHDEAERWLTAAAAFSTTYYGQLAAGELGLQLRGREAATTVAGERSGLVGSEPARMAALLCSLGEYARAVPFVGRLASDAGENPADAAFVVGLGKSCGRADIAVRAAKGVTRNSEPDLRASHPVPRVKGLTAAVAGLPEPALRLAIARQESQFDPTATSPAGARGIMQLMPGTAKGIAQKLDMGYALGRLTSDPDYNARLGSSYLQQQIVRFDGELALALAAYNAGPARVVAWLDQNGDPRRSDAHRLIDWIEMIPFAETRNYVQRVLESRMVYEVVLDGPAVSEIVAAPPPGPRDARDEAERAERES
ncbi:MAG TPA: lytic transglycosylase domain-containing protein [Geminicoccaceae bacterium]|nr:lytic transglycosylase domain-containing protein [Geminicoccus sp.]HMU48799.1 lytic transglycosylase domain-containing protein [Geminicoccaceae bacterium]